MTNIVLLEKNSVGDYVGKTIAPVSYSKDRDHMTVLCRIVSVGEFTDMNGKAVPITEETLATLVDNYNTKITYLYNEHMKSIAEHASTTGASTTYSLEQWEYLPNQLNHEAGDVTKTVGRVVGLMELKYCNAISNFAIFCNINVKHHHNVFNVANDLWRYLSVGFDMDALEFKEVSWVTAGADPKAYKVMADNTMNTTQNNNADLSKNNLQFRNDNDIIKQAYEYCKQLKKLIYIEDELMTLCRERKLYKADTYMLKEQLSNLPDKDSVKLCIDILSNNLKPMVKEIFYPLDKESMDETLKAFNKVKRTSYKSK